MDTAAEAPDERLRAALVEEITKKSSLIWIAAPASGAAAGEQASRPAWHIWRQDAVYVVSGGAEQPIPGLAEAAAAGAEVTVTARSKDKGGRLLRYRARATPVEPGGPAWDAVVPDLHAKRLNAPDGEQQPVRWARESLVTRLEPTGELLEWPGALADAEHAAPPAPTPATTRGPLPAMLGRSRSRRRA